MTYYEKKRRRTSLTRTDVANYLGISYKRYEYIEKGDVKMPKNLIDKFNKLMNKQKSEIRLEQLNREKMVNDWWDEVSKQYSHGRYGLNKYMEQYNISTYNQLAKLMGYSNSTTILNALGHNRKTSYNTKNRYYSFFNNELNIQPNKEQDKNRKQNNAKILTGLEEWLSHVDFKSYLLDYDISQHKFAKTLGVPQSLISRVCNNLDTSGLKTENIKRLKKYYDKTPEIQKYYHEKPIHSLGKLKLDNINKTDDDVDKVETKRVDKIETKSVECPVIKSVTDIEELSVFDKLVKKYQTKINNMDNSIEGCTKQITELRNKLSVLTKERSMYVDFINDLKNEGE